MIYMCLAVKDRLWW